MPKSTLYIVSLFMWLAGCTRNVPPSTTDNTNLTFAAAIARMQMQPLPDAPGVLQPGTVLRGNLGIVAYPDEAYVHPELLRPTTLPAGGDGSYRDSISGFAEIDATLGQLLRALGIDFSARGNSLHWLDTQLNGIVEDTVSEYEIDHAELKPEIIQKMNLGPVNAVTVVQAVYHAKIFRMSFEDDKGFLTSADVTLLHNSAADRSTPTTNPSIGGAASQTSTGTGQIIYDDRIIGYRPYFRGGGTTSELTPSSAEKIAAVLKENGVPGAEAKGNLVVAQPRFDQLALVHSVTEAIWQSDHLSSELETRLAKFDSLSEQVTSLTKQLSDEQSHALALSQKTVTLEQDIQSRDANVAELQTKITQLTDSTADATDKIATLESKLSEAQTRLGNYRNGQLDAHSIDTAGTNNDHGHVIDSPYYRMGDNPSTEPSQKSDSNVAPLVPQ